MDLKNLKEYTDSATPAPVVDLSVEEKSVEKYVAERVKHMQQFRKDLKIEQKWKEADREYIPSEIEFETRRRFESNDETGLRSKLVRIKDEDEDWRSKNSDPTLLVKIQTALSIIIDNNPEAVFKPLGRQNENKTALAKVLWERNWNLSGAKEVYKKYIFNKAKYGWAPMRVFPHLIKYDKDVLTEIDSEDPSKNKYDKRTLTWYNDVDREALNPFRTWIDEQTKPYDEYSMSDSYFEKDYTWDQAKVEFDQYGFSKMVPSPNNDLRVTYSEDSTPSSSSSGPSNAAAAEELKTRKDIVTIGFFESRLRDLHVIRIPKLNAPLYYCPLPNDDGLLSVYHSLWVLRDAESPYGISLWEMIKQKKGLYDKMQNMTMNQLVLSVMKMAFYTGTNNLTGDGTIKIKPGVMKQMVNGKVDWMQIPGPGKESFDGLQFVKNGMDDDSGVTPTLQGSVTGQTLGETQLAKEAALKRLKVPVDNIAYAIEQDAYLSLSWMGQIYSTPEVKEFATLGEIKDYEMEASVSALEMNPTNGFDPNTGAAQGPFQTTFLPEMSLPLEKQGDKLVESRTERFFSMGKDIELGDLKWRGIIKVLPKSIVTSSMELIKQGIKETFSIIAPLLAQPPQIFGKAVKWLLLANEQDPKEVLPDAWLAFLEQDHQSLFIDAPMMPQPGMPGQPGQMPGIPSNQSSLQGAAGTSPLTPGPTAVPAGQINTPSAPGSTGAPRQELTRMQ